MRANVTDTLDLPEPVVPEASRCGVCLTSHTAGAPLSRIPNGRRRGSDGSNTDMSADARSGSGFARPNSSRMTPGPSDGSGFMYPYPAAVMKPEVMPSTFSWVSPAGRRNVA